MTPEADPSSPEASGGITVHAEHSRLTLDPSQINALASRMASGEIVLWREVGIILGDHDLVRDLNKTWLGHDWNTDVVSFPLDEDARARGLIEGEVYVDLDTAEEIAPEVGATVAQEALRYVAHGLLHLIGYDDATNEEREHMRNLEDRYLAR